MRAEDSLKRGDLDETLRELQAEVRAHPNDPKLRVFLFQLLSVLGQWDRALTQLKVSGDLDPTAIAMVQTYRELLLAEVLRKEIFLGKRTPIIFGEPEPWMAYHLTALKLSGEGKIEEAAAARDAAFADAPATRGRVDAAPFEWIADADVRIGPMLEAIVRGRLQWIPLHHLRAIKIEAPVDLRDLVWAPAVLTLATGAETVAFVPTRYPGSEDSPDPAIRLSKKTTWTEKPGGAFVGSGQRLFSTDAGDYPLLDVRTVELESSAKAADAAQGAPG